MSEVPQHSTSVLEQPHGEALRLQKWRVRRAQRRGRVLRAIRCWRGVHNPPANQFFCEMGAVCIGGSCTRCDDPDWHPVTWIGNAWDFGTATKTELPADGGVSYKMPLLATDDAIREHIRSLGVDIRIEPRMS